MRPRFAIATTALISGVLLFAASEAIAAGGGKAPLGAPPSNDATSAYAFRSFMSVTPPCQQLSQEADRVFMDAHMEMDQKVAQLQQINESAKQQNCLQQHQPKTTYGMPPG